MELAAFLWALGDLPAAMAGTGELSLGPQPWALIPLGSLQVFLGATDPPFALRVQVLDGPWFAWLDLPPPRFVLGRAPGYALVAVAREPAGVNLAWEITASPSLSMFGSLGFELACGVRVRWRGMWGAALVRGGGLTLWAGHSF